VMNIRTFLLLYVRSVQGCMLQVGSSVTNQRVTRWGLSWSGGWSRYGRSAVWPYPIWILGAYTWIFSKFQVEMCDVWCIRGQFKTTFLIVTVVPCGRQTRFEHFHSVHASLATAVDIRFSLTQHLYALLIRLRIIWCCCYWFVDWYS